MKIVLIGVAAVAAALATGCANEAGARMGFMSATSPVIAILSDDLFLGEAVGNVSGNGKIELTSVLDETVRCVGEFAYSAGFTTGSGEMLCTDGNRAIFRFNKITNLSGYGVGHTERGAVSFTYGLTLEDSLPYLKLPTGKQLKKSESGKPELVTT